MQEVNDFLDDITGANAPVQETTDGAADIVAEPEKPDLQQEPPTHEVVTGEKNAEAPPATDKSKEEQGTLAGLKAEREKRQEAQRRADELERRLAELQQQQEQHHQRPQFYDDPAAYVQGEVQHATNRIQQQFYAAMEADLREQHADYDDVLQLLTQKAQENPALAQRVFQSANPAKEAYRLGRQIQQLDQMQDPDTYREQLKADVRKELEAELKAQEEAKRKAIDAIPPDLTQARNTRGEFAPKSGDIFQEIF